MATVMAEISSELLQRVRSIAAERGVTPERLAGEWITDALDQEVDLLAAIQEGEADIAAGRVFTQGEVEAMFGVSRDRRSAA